VKAPLRSTLATRAGVSALAELLSVTLVTAEAKHFGHEALYVISEGPNVIAAYDGSVNVHRIVKLSVGTAMLGSVHCAGP
jgi:hypothetical protein